MSVETPNTEIQQHANTYIRRSETMKSESTANRREIDLNAFLKWTDDTNSDVFDLDGFDVEDYLIHLDGEGYSGSVLQSAYYTIRTFYNYLERKELIEEDENPTDDVSVRDFKTVKRGGKKAQASRDKVTYLTREEIQSLCDHAGEAHGKSIRNELLIKLLYETGMRRGELANVRIDDINEDERSIKVRGEKTDDNRIVYYQPDLDFLLSQWLRGGFRDSYFTASESDYLFPTQKSENISVRAINRTVVQAAEAAGLQETVTSDQQGRNLHKITSHVLRHTFAVHSLKYDENDERPSMNLRSLMEVMGHDNLSTTQIYLNVAQDDVREEVQRCGPQLGSD